MAADRDGLMQDSGGNLGARDRFSQQIEMGRPTEHEHGYRNKAIEIKASSVLC